MIATSDSHGSGHHFFFQAEDGIRDADVTGFRRVLFRSTIMPGEYSFRKFLIEPDVQIVLNVSEGETIEFNIGEEIRLADRTVMSFESGSQLPLSFRRSEERRVGKEWRCGLALCREKKE